jgi:transcriptional regulator with XRE-family HTH domain
MPKEPVEIAQTGVCVAEGIQTLRKARGLSLQGLSDRLSALGRPIPLASLSKVENRTRRIDADDLVALAVALGVNPNRLLLPVDGDVVTLTPALTAGLAEAWMWADGQAPLLAEGVPDPGQTTEDFAHHARPTGQQFRFGHEAVQAATRVISRIQALADDDLERQEDRERVDGRLAAIRLGMAVLSSQVEDLVNAAQQVRSDLNGER